MQSSERQLPRWVIPVAVAGGVLSLVLLLAFAGSLVWLTSQAQGVLTAGPKPVPSPETVEPPKLHPAPPNGSFKPHADSGSRSGQEPNSESSRDIAAQIQSLADSYLAAQRDGTIYDLVPGGEQVDPAYTGAFLFALTDLKSASRFGGSSAQLQELLDKAHTYEERFLAGEDLGTSVKITREDGSVFESDGKYRLID
ncbi:hypothetical protein ACXR2T_13750 [Leucobacter sp. HY1910]